MQQWLILWTMANAGVREKLKAIMYNSW